MLVVNCSKDTCLYHSIPRPSCFTAGRKTIYTWRFCACSAFPLPQLQLTQVIRATSPNKPKSSWHGTAYFNTLHKHTSFPLPPATHLINRQKQISATSPNKPQHASIPAKPAGWNHYHTTGVLVSYRGKDTKMEECERIAKELGGQWNLPGITAARLWHLLHLPSRPGLGDGGNYTWE